MEVRKEALIHVMPCWRSSHSRARASFAFPPDDRRSQCSEWFGDCCQLALVVIETEQMIPTVLSLFQYVMYMAFSYGYFDIAKGRKKDPKEEGNNSDTNTKRQL